MTHPPPLPSYAIFQCYLCVLMFLFLIIFYLRVNDFILDAELEM